MRAHTHRQMHTRPHVFIHTLCTSRAPGACTQPSSKQTSCVDNMPLPSRCRRVYDATKRAKQQQRGSTQSWPFRRGHVGLHAGEGGSVTCVYVCVVMCCVVLCVCSQNKAHTRGLLLKAWKLSKPQCGGVPGSLPLLRVYLMRALLQKTQTHRQKTHRQKNHRQKNHRQKNHRQKTHKTCHSTPSYCWSPYDFGDSLH